MKFKINIPIDANNLIHALQEKGYSAYVVGGCIRDSIIGREVHDWDICTSATPTEMLDIFSDKKIIETGLKHGTVTVVKNGEPYEITTFRIDGIYSDNRRPDNVSFTNNLEEDLKRRDFTINAMAYNDEEGLVDPFNGIEDINNKIIKCVGSAEERFNEDALRILRAIRFSTQLGFNVEYNTKKEIHKQYQNLKNISIERINSEFCKIVLSNNFNFTFNLMRYKKVFSLFIPEIKDMFDFEQNNPYHLYSVWLHTINAIKYCEDDELIVKLAVLFHDIGKPHCYQDDEDGIRHFKGHGKVSAEMTDKIMKRLKFDNETRESVVELVFYHDATFEYGNKNVRRWLNKIGEVQFRRLLKVKKADIKAQNPIFKEERINKVNTIYATLEDVLTKEQCFSLKDLAINGKDVMDECSIKEGKEVGFYLNKILNLVIDGELANEKDDLINYINGFKRYNDEKEIEQ